MRRTRQSSKAEREWSNLKSNLDQLARLYRVSWNWNDDDGDDRYDNRRNNRNDNRRGNNRNNRSNNDRYDNNNRNEHQLWNG